MATIEEVIDGQTGDQVRIAINNSLNNLNADKSEKNDANYTTSGTDENLTSPNDNFNTAANFVPIIDTGANAASIRIGLLGWVSTGVSGLGLDRIYIGEAGSPTTYGTIEFDYSLNAETDWSAVADSSNNGLKTFTLPKSANADGLGGSFQYYFDSAAWNVAFPNGSTDKVIIALSGSVYKGSIAKGNLVVTIDGVIGSAGIEINGKTINQTAHGFTKRMALDKTGGVYVKAKSDTPSISGRWICSGVIDVNNFKILKDGFLTDIGHGLTNETDYFVSDVTAGDTTSTEPINPSYSSPAFYVIDADTLDLTIHQRAFQPPAC